MPHLQDVSREHEAVHLLGELDLATAPRAASRLRDALASRRAVVVDLRSLAFLDVAGLRVILAAAADARRRATRFVVVRGTPEVDRVFGLTGTEGLLELVRLDVAQHCSVVFDLDDQADVEERLRRYFEPLRLDGLGS